MYIDPNQGGDNPVKRKDQGKRFKDLMKNEVFHDYCWSTINQTNKERMKKKEKENEKELSKTRRKTREISK